MRQLIVGYGQIGQAVYELINRDTHQSKDIYIYDPQIPDKRPVGTVDVMHVCFPYSNSFVDALKHYIGQYEPEHLIIWSTVAIGTTRQFKHAIHSPVEGKHPQLASSLYQMRRWYGCNTDEDYRFAREYFDDLGFHGERQRPVERSDFTEALKLFSTTEYGVNILFADYKKQVADAIGMDFELTKKWNKDYNELYRKLGFPQFQKFMLDPPNGKIGGHCIVPNAELLDEQFPNDLVKKIWSHE